MGIWFGETAWPTMLFLAGLAILLFYTWQQNRRGHVLLAAGLCLLLIPVVWYVEQLIVTPREEVENSILEITQAFQQKRDKETLDYISPQAPLLRLLAAGAIKIVDVSDDMRVSDITVDLGEKGVAASAQFRVNAHVSYMGQGGQHQPTRWDSKWTKESDGKWRMTSIQELDPITGEKLDRIQQIPGLR